MALNVTPVPGTNTFTPEMLAHNFTALAKQSEALEEWMYLIEGRLGEITRQNFQLAKKLSGRKKLFVAGALTGITVTPLIARKVDKTAQKIEDWAKDYDRQQKSKSGRIIDGEVADDVKSNQEG